MQRTQLDFTIYRMLATNKNRILSLFLRGDKDAESHAINEINARCECLGVSASELISQVEEQIETVFSYEEEQKKLSESAIYWTNIAVAVFVPSRPNCFLNCRECKHTCLP